MPRKSKRKLFYYDWDPRNASSGEKNLNFISMLVVDFKKSPGISRLFSEPGTRSDPLCQLYWGGRLDPDGVAIQDAKRICGEAPEGFEMADRFNKEESELEG